MDKIKKLVQKNFARVDFDLTEKMSEQFVLYAQILLDWNKKMNLTAITDPEEIVVKHFVDSAMLLKTIKLENQANIIDVGTGAGFPGVPIKILRPDVNLTLLDSLNKRLVFLDALLKSLSMEACLIHSRAEDAARKNEFRESFDLVTSRAVAKMKTLSEYCLAYVKVGGVFAPLKGPAVTEELSDAKEIIKKIGCEIKKVELFELADASKRSIIVIEKVTPTPSIYPRHTSQILKEKSI